MAKCQKSYCLRQVNPTKPNIYFGVSFEKDHHWMGCYLCDLESTYVGKELHSNKEKPKLLKRQKIF